MNENDSYKANFLIRDRQELSSLSSCFIRLQWVPGHLLLRGNDAAESWPDGERYLRSLQSLVVSLLLSLVSTLFSDSRCTVSSKFFDTQVPSISTEGLLLPRHACCILSRLLCNGHSLLLSSYLFSIGRIENPSCSACGHSSQDTSHLIQHCPAMDSAPLAFWEFCVSLQPLVQVLGSYLACGAPWPSAMPPSLVRGRVTTTIPINWCHRSTSMYGKSQKCG